MVRKKTSNINFIVGMAKDFVNGGNNLSFVLDFTVLLCSKVR